MIILALKFGLTQCIIKDYFKKFDTLKNYRDYLLHMDQNDY